MGVFWTGAYPGRGRPMYEDGEAPPAIQVLAALQTAELNLEWGEWTTEHTTELQAQGLAACSMDELAALMAVGPPAAREAAILELGRRAP